MKSGLKPRDESEIDRLFARRAAAAGQPRTDLARYLSLRAMVEDFDGVRDVKAFAAESAALARDKSIRAALKKSDDEDDREERMLIEVWKLEGQLASSDDRAALLADLRRRWQSASDAANKAEDSSERRLARRVLSGLNANLRSTDLDYLRSIAEYRPSRGGR